MSSLAADRPGGRSGGDPAGHASMLPGGHPGHALTSPVEVLLAALLSGLAAGERKSAPSLAAGERDDEGTPADGTAIGPHPSEAFSAAAGPDLAAVLASLEPADADDFTLGEALRATERLVSWAASAQARIVQELTARAGSGGQWVRDDVAALLTMTGRAAEVIVARATLLDLVPEVHSALAAGRVDVRRVDTIVRTTSHLPVDRVRDVIGEVLPRAGDLTGPQVRDALRKADADDDPAALERRAAAARADRCVSLEPAPDAMAWLTAYLPADDAMRVWTAVDALANAPVDPTDRRTLDERRADALTSVLGDVLDKGRHPDGTQLTKRQGQRPHVSVVVSQSLLEPGAVGVAHLDGYGPIPASIARRIAAGADRTILTTDPRTGEAVQVSDKPFRPTGEAPAATEPVEPTGPTGQSEQSEQSRSTTPRAHPPGAVSDRAEPAVEPPERATGVDGSSPTPVDRRTDATGPREAAGGYRPPARLRDAILLRDRTCTFPGCRQPAVRCDIDHIVPFDPDRPARFQTTEENLHALCRRHHRLKTHGGWTVARDPITGATVWTSPTGHVHTRKPARLTDRADAEPEPEPEPKPEPEPGPADRPQRDPADGPESDVADRREPNPADRQEPGP